MYWRVGAPTVVSMNSTSQQTVMRPRVAVIVATAVCVAAPGARSGDRSARGTWQQLVNCAVTSCDRTFKHLRCVSTSGILEDAAGLRPTSHAFEPSLTSPIHEPRAARHVGVNRIKLPLRVHQLVKQNWLGRDC